MTTPLVRRVFVVVVVVVFRKTPLSFPCQQIVSTCLVCFFLSTVVEEKAPTVKQQNKKKGGGGVDCCEAIRNIVY
jgi:hypothetical protein